MGSKVGRTIFIPRITHITQEDEYPLQMRRKQFSIIPAFAVTANKSQGQTFDKIGVYYQIISFLTDNYTWQCLGLVQRTT